MAAATTSAPAPANAAGSAPAAAPVAYPNSASLYCGDLQPEVNEAHLMEVFGQIGNVQSILVVRHKVTRRSLGYAYINFHSMTDAERALEALNFTLINGRPCRLMWCNRDPNVRRNNVGNIFIKNLDKGIDNKALHDTFTNFGNVLSCKVEMEEKNGELVSKGFGFVHFETQEAADAAVEKMNNINVNGKPIFVGHFRKKVERNEAGTEIKYTNIFVKNLPLEVSDEKLKEMFTPFGEITSAVVMCGEGGESKGFGFVNFKEFEGARAAVEAMDSKEFEGKTLYCGRAQKKDERIKEMQDRFERQRAEQISKTQGRNLYVKNLDESMNDDKLRAEFGKYGDIASAKVMTDDKGVSRGFGFVCFVATEDANKAVDEMNGKMIGSKPLYVAIAQRRDVRAVHLQAERVARGGNIPPGQMAYAPAGAAPLYSYQQNMPANFSIGYPGGQPGQPMMRRPWPQQQGGQPGGVRGGQPGGYGQPGMPYPGQMGQRGPVGMPGQQGGPNMYPNNGGRGGAPNAAGRPQQGAPRGAPNGGMPAGGQPAPQGGAVPAGGANAASNRRYKFQQNVRNPAPAASGAPMPAGGPAPVNPAVAGLNPNTPLTTAMLASIPEGQQTRLLGDRLYPLVGRITPEYAGKVTGMLLRMDNAEVLNLLESPELLTEQVAAALDVLKQHDARKKQETKA